MEKFQLSESLNKQLREKVNYRENYILNHTIKIDNKDVPVWDCICAIMDRIDDISTYLNKLSKKVVSKKDVFALCDFFNQSQTLIDCIEKSAQIFQIKLKDNSSTIFNKNGTDDNYFKYLRSLCSVHPVSTNKHKEFQKYGNEWCAYISPSDTIAVRLHDCLLDEKSGDYVAVTYTEKCENINYVPIFLNKIFSYIQNRHKCITKIIDKIEENYGDWVKKLINKLIPTVEDCNNNYLRYLYNLIEAITERLNKYVSYNAKHWIRVYRTKFNNKEFNDKFEEYKNEMKLGIKKIHNKLQSMDIDKEDLNPWSHINTNAIKGYGYQTEKILSLYYSEEYIDDIQTYKEKPFICDRQFRDMFILMDKFIDNYATKEELYNLTIHFECDYSDKYGVSIPTSIWARLQLKVMEPLLRKYVKFDYALNNWQLYMQYKTALYLLNRNCH